MSHSSSNPGATDKWVNGAIALIVVLFAIATMMGYTQAPSADHGADTHAAAEGDKSHGEPTSDSKHPEADGHTEHTDHAAEATDEGEAESHGGGHHGVISEGRSQPHLWAVIPFVLLLGSIAVLPLLSFTEHWWESNKNRFIVAAVLGVITLIYFLLFYSGFEHEIFGAGGFAKIIAVLDHAILKEYIPFIVLLFSLYTISGGIRIQGDVPAHPMTNVIFIAIGGLLASFIGTTGAAMLLIRPLLETNKERKYKQHTVVFFIFVVCNCGGCLLPIGDPPLFLGYLMGVNFLWTMWNLWQPWLAINIMILVVYFVWDAFVCYPREEKKDIQRDETQVRKITIRGLWPNALLLLGVIFAVALLDPSKAIPGTTWHPWVFLREVVQLAMVALSLMLGARAPREGNKFNYHAIVEVAALFIGIFICMQPAIAILDKQGKELGVNTPEKAFWATGTLSAVLDNAPTYVVFFTTAEGQFPSMYEGQDKFAARVSQVNLEKLKESVPPNAKPTPKFIEALKEANDKRPKEEQVEIPEIITPELVEQNNNLANQMLIGIALGAVFMGSMTYIGNGPNFMVRAIAEESGVKMPSFFGYVIFYSIPVLVPIFIIATYIFV